MARVRQARRCRGHRSDGQPCQAYAIVGGYVCRAHGGAAPQVRREAEIRALEASMRRGFAVAWQRWKREMVEWQVRRILITAEVMGVPVESVTDEDIWMAAVYHGALTEPKPVIGVDRRFGPRRS